MKHPKKSKRQPPVSINLKLPAEIVAAVTEARGEEPFSRFAARSLATSAGHPELARDLPGRGRPKAAPAARK